MPQLDFTITNLFRLAFGVTPKFVVPEEQVNNPQLNYSGIETLPEYYSSTETSWMGTPILFSAKFAGGGYNRYTATGELETVNMPDYRLPATTLFSFRRAKNITRTNLLGSNGTVKEIYGFDDWIINVKGLCLDDAQSSAQDKFTELQAWEELADSITITGQLFNAAKIDAVTIADWAHEVPQGSPGVVAFQFSMYSDEAKDLVL